MIHWYYLQDGTRRGPVTTTAIKVLAATGEIKPEDWVWREGLKEWKPARKIVGLFPNVELLESPPPPPPVQTTSATTNAPAVTRGGKTESRNGPGSSKTRSSPTPATIEADGPSALMRSGKTPGPAIAEPPSSPITRDNPPNKSGLQPQNEFPRESTETRKPLPGAVSWGKRLPPALGGPPPGTTSAPANTRSKTAPATRRPVHWRWPHLRGWIEGCAVLVAFLSIAALEFRRPGSSDTTRRAPALYVPSAENPHGETAPLFRVIRNGRYGFINAQGRLVIDARFDLATPFAEGVAAAKHGPKWGFLKPDGQWAMEPQFDMAQSFSEGLAAVRREGKYGFVNQDGKLIIPCQFLEARSFSEGLAAVRTEKGWGYISREGKITIEAQFTLADPFSGGLASVRRKDDAYGYLDRAGKFVWQPSK